MSEAMLNLVTSIASGAFSPHQLISLSVPGTIADDAFPEDCAAVFHVVSNSPAERYCREKGFQVQIEP